jgi:hypothetical protein
MAEWRLFGKLEQQASFLGLSNRSLHEDHFHNQIKENQDESLYQGVGKVGLESVKTPEVFEEMGECNGVRQS